MENRKSLYYLPTKKGTCVYDMNNNLIGKTTYYRAIAHNGKCIGSIQIENTNGKLEWISGYGVFIVGMGIKIVE